MIFINREEAGLKLAHTLKKNDLWRGVILAVPRGGVPVGYAIAKELNIPLEIILSKKIGHPRNPEFAIGSISLHGVILNESSKDISPTYIKHEAERLKKSMLDKFHLFMGNREPVSLKNKTVIIVDDGIATGSTIIASIQALRTEQPKKIVVAVPVAAPSSVKKIESIADQLICLAIPSHFAGVGQFYKDFAQVSDEEVVALLEDANISFNKTKIK